MHKFGGRSWGDNNFPERARGKIKTAFKADPLKERTMHGKMEDCWVGWWWDKVI